MRVTSYRPGAAAAKPVDKLLPLPATITRRRPALRSLPARTKDAAPPFHATVLPDRLTITLPVPPSINHQYATVHNRRLLSAEGRGYKAEVGHHILMALARAPHKETLRQTLRTRYLSLTVRFYFASPLRRDVDSGLKITQDALCEALGVNDNRVLEIHLYKALDTTRPRIELILTPVARQSGPSIPHA